MSRMHADDCQPMLAYCTWMPWMVAAMLGTGVSMNQCHCEPYAIYIRPSGECTTKMGQFWNCSPL